MRFFPPKPNFDQIIKDFKYALKLAESELKIIDEIYDQTWQDYFKKIAVLQKSLMRNPVEPTQQEVNGLRATHTGSNNDCYKQR